MPPRNQITQPARLPLIAASILSADFADLAADSRAVLDAGADLLHLDVMDGHFVPNLTMGPALCAALRRAMPKVTLDVHLMVTDPRQFIRPFADAGADHVTAHIEVEPDPAGLAGAIHDAGMTAGLSLNPGTGAASVLPHLSAFDLILIMSVNPGFSGQQFMPEVLEKARAITPRLRADQRLEIDGGVNATTAVLCRQAGCDMLVAASSIFNADDYAQAIMSLRESPATSTRSR